jgi:ABC-2 type transport system permease protein
VIYLACAVFLGLWAGVIMNTQSAALQLVQFVSFLFSLLLSGFIFPVANIPAAIRWIALFVPARYYIDLARDAMLRGSGWELAMLPLIALALLTLLFFLAAWSRLRRMQFRD